MLSDPGFDPSFVLGPVVPVIALALLIVNVFHVFMITLMVDMKLKDAGCPEEMSYLLYTISSVFFFLPRAIGDK